jgi:hypothetical protein
MQHVIVAFGLGTKKEGLGRTYRNRAVNSKLVAFFPPGGHSDFLIPEFLGDRPEYKIVVLRLTPSPTRMAICRLTKSRLLER